MAKNIVEIVIKVKGTKAKEEIRKTGEEAEKAGDKVEQMAKKSTQAMQKTERTTKRTRKEFMAIRRDTANLDRLTSELASAFNLLSPALSKAATQTSQAAGGMEGVARIFTVANPKILAVVATIGLITASWQLYRRAERKAEEEHMKFVKRMDDNLTELESFRKGVDQLATAMENLQTSQMNLDFGTQMLRLQTANLLDPSEITRADLTEAGFVSQGIQLQEQRIKTQEKFIEGLKAEIKLHRATISVQEDKQKQARALPPQVTTVVTGAFTTKEIIKRHDLGKADQHILDTARKTLKERKEALRIASENLRLLKEGQGPLAADLKARRDAMDALVDAQRTVEQTKVKEDARNKATRRREKNERKIKNLIDEQLKSLEVVTKLQETLNNENESSRRALVQSGAKILQQRASLLRLQAQQLEGADKESKLNDAHVMESKARNQILQERIKLLQEEKSTTAEQMSQSAKNLSNAKRELEQLRQKTKNKKLLKKVENEIAVATDKNTQIQVTGALKIEKLDKRIQKQRIEATLEQQQADERHVQRRIKDEERIRKEKKRTSDEEKREAQKNQRDREREIKNLISKIRNAFQSIFDPGQFVSNLASSIGNIFGDVGGSIGQAFGGFIGSVASFGESLIVRDPKTGQERTKTDAELQQEFDNFVAAFERGLEKLPVLLAKILPKFTIAVAKGIIMAIPLLIESFLHMIGNAIDKLVRDLASILSFEKQLEDFTEKLKANLNAIAQALTGGLFQGFFRSGGRIKSARNGMRVTSGSFGAAQLAAVHPNEIITPQSGSRPQAIDRTLDQMSGKQGVTVVINSAVTESNAIDGLVRRIEQRFQTFGSAKSPLFG